MAELLKLKGKQLELITVGDEHINPASKITEAKLNLDVGTQSLSDSLNTVKGKFLAVMTGVYDFYSCDANTNSIDVSELIDPLENLTINNSPGGSPSAAGVITSGAYNKVSIVEHYSKEPIEKEGTNFDIFGRLTEAGGVVTLTFYYNDGSSGEQVTTLHTDNAYDIDLLVPESIKLEDIPFTAMTTGVGFVDGLPASHQHVVSEISDITKTASEINDLVTLARLDDVATDAAGAILVGVEDNLVNVSGAEVQAVLEDIDSKAAFLSRLNATTDGASGADIIGVTASNFNNISSTDVQAALEELDNLVGSGVSSREGSDNLTAQVDDVDPALFTVTHTNYLANSLEVYVNGSKQVRGLQYTETTPASGIFTFIAGAIPAGTDVVDTTYNHL